MKTNNNSRSRSNDLCRFPFADGRRCHMLRHHNHPALCFFHAREEQQLLESHRLGDEISKSLTGDLLTASDINHVLSKLFYALAQNGIPQRRAHTLAYIGSALLRSIPLVKGETRFHYTFEQWQDMIKEAAPLSQTTWPSLEPPRLPEGPARGSTVGDQLANAPGAAGSPPQTASTVTDVPADIVKA